MRRSELFMNCLNRSCSGKGSGLKFIETMYGGCLLNMSEVVGIFDVISQTSDFPYEHTVNNVTGDGVYAALKVGQNCHTFAVVTMKDIHFTADVALSGGELECYLEILKTDEEQRSLISEIIFELMYRIEKPSVFIDTWDVVKTSISNRSRIYSAGNDDEDLDEEPVGTEAASGH